MILDGTGVVRLTVDNDAGSSVLWVPGDGWAEETPPEPPAKLGGLPISWQ